MPYCYVSGGFIFTKVREDEDGTCYYDITHSSGRTWDYAHKFISTKEMDEYASRYRS